jgi:hypothetical protein
MGLCRAAWLPIQTEHHDQQRQDSVQWPSARDLNWDVRINGNKSYRAREPTPMANLRVSSTPR